MIHVSGMRCGLVVPLLAASLAAQTVHRVGASQPFATIQDAIDAAAPGDIVAVDAGTYPAFTLNKGLTIRAEPTGAVVQAGTGTPWLVLDVPTGGHARLSGLELKGVTSQGPGVVSFEQCDVRGQSLVAHSLRITNGHVTM